MKIVAVLSGVLVSASLSCTKHADGCQSNTDCTNPAYPFCDVDGAYPPSDGVKNICTITPPDCPASVCGCSPGAATCGSDQLIVCNADGSSTTTTTCALGCGSDGVACLSFTPSNGLGPILTQAGSAADFVIPPGATIDTSVCEIEMSNMSLLSGSLIAQSSGKICAFAAHNFTVGDVVIAGTYPVAFVAANDLAISGVMDAGAKGSALGPGAQPAGSPCDGGGVIVAKCNAGSVPQALSCSQGAGGGGGATSGGSGGTDSFLSTDAVDAGSGYGGTMALAKFSPLVGGCSGGGGSDTVTNAQGSTVYATISEKGGGGGGAVQLVAGETLELNGIVNLGGGGGPGSAAALGSDGMTVYYDYQGAGGGAGGTLLIEAPIVTIGAAGGFAANGGGGGACGAEGMDGSPDAIPAAGGMTGSGGCQGVGYSFVGGSGGTALVAPSISDFDDRAAMETNADAFGGGGGAIGCVKISTRTGSLPTSTSLQSAFVTASALIAN